MRNLSKAAILGATLALAACGGDNSADVNNTMTTDMNMADPMMESTNDVTAIDAGTGADANMAMDANMTMDANATTTNTDANMTNGM